MRVLYILLCAASAAIASHFGQPDIRENSDAITVMITVMTVFAGFLVAIIAVLGDPAMIPKGSWRKAELRHQDLEYSLIRQTWLFYTYLAAIAFLFAGLLLRKEPVSLVPELWKRWIEYTYLFLSIFSFLLALSLPSALARIQLTRSAEEIELRRREAGISNLPRSSGS